MLKKFTSAIIVFLMTLSVMSVAVVSANAATGQNIYQAEKVGDGNITKEVTSEKRYDGSTRNGTTFYTYNSNGKLTKKDYSRKDSNGFQVNDVTTYSYNSNGNLIKETYSGTTSEGYKGNENTTYTYNNNGKLIKKIYYYKFISDWIGSRNYKTTTTYTYNKNGKLTKVIWNTKYDDGSSSVGTITYTYNKNGRIVKNVYKSDNYTDSKTYTYNSNGNLTKIVEYSKESNTEATSTTTLTYNSNGKPTKSVSSSKSTTDSGTSKTTYTYNKKDNLTKRTYYTNSTSSDQHIEYSEKTTYTYNKNGKLIKKNFSYDGYEGYPCNETTTYKYNSNGKLIKEIVTDKGFSTNTFSEEITTTTTKYSYNNKGSLTQKTKNSECGDGEAETTITTYSDSNKNLYSCSLDDFYLGGEMQYNFSIAKSVTLTGKNIRPEITVTDCTDAPFIEGVDYTISYTSNTKAGTGKVLFTPVDFPYFTIEIPFTIVPAQVKSLKATKVSTNSIDLSWKKVNGATYYKVEQSLDGKTWSTIKTFKANKLTVYSLKAGTKYQFRVTALDASKEIAGKTSAILKTGTLTTAPTITIESTKSNTATVKIDKVKGATKYNIYLSTDGKTLTKVKTTTGTTATIKDLTGGERIYVRVRAVNAYGKTSEYSNVAKVNVKK